MESALPLLLLLLLSLGVGFFALFISRLITPRSSSVDKVLPYECGFDHFSDEPFQFDIRFYLVAILFIIFDLEIAFLFPWAVIFKESMTDPALLAMGGFLFLLLLGFVYEWKKGALEWE